MSKRIEFPYLHRTIEGLLGLILFCAFFLSPLHAQDCQATFLGQVIDLHNNQPLANAKITVAETNKQLLTNATGHFVLENLCAQPQRLWVEHPSCEAREIQIAPPFSGVKKIYLEHHIEALEEIIITEQAESKITRTGVEQRLTKKDLDRYRAASFGDALAQLAGVSKIKTGNAIVKPMVHGFSGTRLAIVQDGIRLQDHEWGADHAPSIDLNGVEEIHLIKGANALRFGGDVVGGIIHLKPRRFRPEDRFGGALQTGGQSQGQGGYVLGNWTRTFQTGYHYGGSFSLKNQGDLSSPDHVLSNTGNREQHVKAFFGRNTFTQQWQLGYQYFGKTAGILSAAHLGTLGDLARAIESATPLIVQPWTRDLNSPKQHTQHHTFTAKYEHRLNEKIRWETQYSFQWNNRQEFDLRRGEAKYRPALDLRLLTHDLQLHTRMQRKENWRWSVGMAGQLQDNFSDPATGVRRLIPDYLRFKTGIYGVSEYFPNNALNLEFGLRYDYDHLDVKKYYRISDWQERGYSPQYDNRIIATGNASSYLTHQRLTYHNFSASAGIKQRLGGSWGELRWSLGYSTRSPNPAELFSDGLHHALATIEKGDLRLVQEKALKNVLSWEGTTAKGSYQWVFHHSLIQDYIQLVPDEDGFDMTRNSAYLVRKYQPLPQVSFVGAEGTFAHRFSKQFAMETSMAWVRGQTKDQTPLIEIPPFRFDTTLEYNHRGRFPFEALLQLSHVAQQKRYPNTNFTYAFIENNALTTRTIDISTPPPAYTLLGLEVGTKLKKQLELRFFVDNLFDIRYRDYLNRLRYFTHETGRNVRFNLTYTFL